MRLFRGHSVSRELWLGTRNEFLQPFTVVLLLTNSLLILGERSRFLRASLKNFDCVTKLSQNVGRMK